MGRAMSRDFPVRGLAELDKYLSHLPANMQKQAYRGMVTAIARPIRDEARLLAPKRTGKMAKSIKTGSARQNQDGSFQVSVRLQGPHAFLGVMHEFGVSPHFISAGDADMSAKLLTRAGKREGIDVVSRKGGKNEPEVLKIGENYISGGVMHPGHAAHPFMRPALDAKADEAVRAGAVFLRNWLEGKTGFVAPMDEAA
jgi:HK97 gp10 family phage protein